MSYTTLPTQTDKLSALAKQSFENYDKWETKAEL